MRVKHGLLLALAWTVGVGSVAQAQQASPSPVMAKPLTRQEIQALQREGSVAANLEAAYASAVQAHASVIRHADQLALNQVFDARTRLMNVRNLKLADADLDRALNDLLNLTTLAQRRLSSRSPAAEEAVRDLVLRFSQTMASLPVLGGGGGAGQGALILTQKLAPELVLDVYRALASAQVDLAQGQIQLAEARLDEAQRYLQAAEQAPGNERIQDLVVALEPAIQVAQMQLSQNAAAALASTTKAVDQLANRLNALR